MNNAHRRGAVSAPRVSMPWALLRLVDSDDSLGQGTFAQSATNLKRLLPPLMAQEVLHYSHACHVCTEQGGKV